MNCHRVFKQMTFFFYSGLAVMLLAWLIGNVVSAPFCGVLMAIGGVACFGGIIYGKVCLRCPHCGASLFRGRTLPTKVPAYCSDCGERL